MPKAKISEDMIVDAALQVAREEGAESINARTVAERLNCSTQLFYIILILLRMSGRQLLTGPRKFTWHISRT